MKIYESGMPIIKQKSKSIKLKETNDDFQRIMDCIDPRQGNKKIITTEISEIKPIDGIKIIHGTESTGRVKEDNLTKEQLVRKIEDTLDLIDSYSKNLADISKPSSRLNTLVGHLEDRIVDLQKFESNPGTPERLKPFISEISITMGAEIAKFRRGDYL